MGKRSRDRQRTSETSPGEVGPRQPCPCGSGRRYKACHGSAGGATSVFVRRPFAGLAAECDLVAMREFLPSGTAAVRVQGHEDRDVLLGTLLPGAAPAMVREDGTVWLGMQVQHGFGDASRDLAAALLTALEGEPGQAVDVVDDPGAGPRLQDVLVDAPLEVTVHEGFEWWLADVDDPDGSLAAALENANSAITPTRRLSSVEGAYWCDVSTKEYLRWAIPHDEDPLLDALARLHAAGDDRLVDDSRMVGMFRAHGLLVPVWDLVSGTGADRLEEPAAAFATALEDALATTEPLTGDERAARAGLANRQLTLR